ncbi:hypothetical protein B0F90DRAFT_1718861 [Multifurca ochricompacta]|uniref:Glycosyltransferase family 32 protein n=1 Tax=Multifurca ochricompacta TaxID=376703 RepID=A0AAD4M497_9AGAM|nr:hypothetical protein B0F90DRAFT_1718861 [Multifurca ochricompacta]
MAQSREEDPTSPIPRFRLSTSQDSNTDSLPSSSFSLASASLSRERIPRALRRTRSRWSLAPVSFFLHSRVVLIIFVPLFFLTAVILRWAYATWELHLMLDFYPRQWWAQSLPPVPPLRGCFSPERVSSLYNISDHVFGARHTDIQAGMLLSLGVDCYDFASTIRAKGVPAHASRRTNFHSLWPAERAPFGARQEAMLKSFLTTQPLGSSRLVLWSHGDVSTDALLRAYTARYRDVIELRVVDLSLLAMGTEVEDSSLVKSNDPASSEYLLRLLILWQHGGVWVDMDSLLTRDLSPLLEHEFVTQWECDYDKNIHPMTSALMHFYQHSPYLCEAFHVLVTSLHPHSSADSVARLYGGLWSRLIAESWPPFKVLPFCFSDGRSCDLRNQLPNPLKPDGKWVDDFGLEEGGGLDQRLQKVFAVHLHDRGNGGFPDGGWVQRLLIERYDRSLSNGGLIVI